MLGTRWNPLTEMQRLQSEMNRLFDRWGSNGSRPLSQRVYPPLNMWEDEGHLFVEAELPGFELAELEILVTGGNQLSLKGQRKETQLEGGTWHRQERGFGQFSRIVELPASVDSDNVSAEFKHGILLITLPKSEAAKPRRIEVKCS